MHDQRRTSSVDVTKEFKSGFVSIIGRPNVGKSTLLNQILGQKIAITANKPQTTRNRILGIHTTNDAQVLFLDTPGIHKATGKLNKYMVDQALSACRGVDAVLFLVEATDRVGGGDDYILDLLAQSELPIFLVINKVDLVAKDKLLPLIQAYSERFNFQEIIPASAATGEGVESITSLVTQCLPSGPMYYPEDMVTDMPERFIVAEMIREQILHRTHQEVPYGVAVQVETFEERPGKNLVAIQAVIHVGRDAHKRILVGKGGSMIRTLGQESRREIEAFLGTRVFLELFIKVKKNWMDSDRMLREFGYE
ncbi:MAG: GTPase Era [Desulfobacteraceae bacterium 4572_35.2]|nr:MAG: GTPase Era [Desulfobacteraceae bacterium 4572_35.2]